MTLIPGAVSGVIMPKIAWLHGKSESGNIKLTYFSSTRYLILITLPIIFAGIAIIDLPVSILYGSQYLPLIPAIQILLISGGLSAIVASAAAVLYGTGRQKFILKLASTAAIINILLDLLLIPAFGAIGASFANAVSQIFGSIVGTYYLSVILKMPFPYKDSAKIFISALGAGLLIFLIKELLLFLNPVFLLFILSVSFLIFYYFSLLSLNFFTKQDNDILQKVTSRFPFLLKIRL
jgi:O-antigen/teichoic acid export membrane protein